MTSHREHDRNPYDAAETEEQLRALKAILTDTPSTILDVGCGGGRLARGLAVDGHRILGLDLDPECGPRFLEATGSRGRFLTGDLLKENAIPDERFDLVLMMGNFLMEFRDPRDLRTAFRHAADSLDPGGRLVMDDVPSVGWAEIADGRWASGLDESGTMQMVWAPCDPEFVLRMGDDIDLEADRILDHERVLRLWSRRELDDAAGFAHLRPVAGVETTTPGLLLYERSSLGNDAPEPTV